MRVGPKFEALRRSLVRLIGGPATSGEGEIPRTLDPSSPGGFHPIEVGVSFSPSDLQRYATPPKPKPHPLAPEFKPPPLNWDVWCRMEREHRAPGWAFCRYATRSPPPANEIACVFGMTRAPFGIHGVRFYLCDPINAIEPVWGVTHLRSGFGVGLFSQQGEAVTAAEIASRMAIDWDAFNPDDPDRAHATDALTRCQIAWVNAGIIMAPFHAHHNDDTTPPIPVWYLDPEVTELQRPEKLS